MQPTGRALDTISDVRVIARVCESLSGLIARVYAPRVIYAKCAGDGHDPVSIRTRDHGPGSGASFLARRLRILPIVCRHRAVKCNQSYDSAIMSV